MKRTPQLEEAIMRALRAGSTRTAAAEYVGVDRVQLWRWMKSDVTFRNAVTRAEAEAEVACTGTIKNAAREGDWHAALAWLERRRPEDWGRKDRVDIVAIVRVMAAQAGLSDEETATAVAEAERYLKELSGAASR
jgi:hypothetical protein